MTEGKYKYIKFDEVKAHGKSIWVCRNISTNSVLATIEWYAPWQRYCFCPEPGMGIVYDVGCLKDIIDFIGKLKKGEL